MGALEAVGSPEAVGAPEGGVSVACTRSRVHRGRCWRLPRLVWAPGSEGRCDDPRAAGEKQRGSRGVPRLGASRSSVTSRLCRAPPTGVAGAPAGWGADLDCSASAALAVAWVVALCGGGVRGRPSPRHGASSVAPCSQAVSGGLAPPRSLGVAPVWVRDGKPRSAPLCPLTSRRWLRRLWVSPGASLSLAVLVHLHSGPGATGSMPGQLCVTAFRTRVSPHPPLVANAGCTPPGSEGAVSAPAPDTGGSVRFALCCGRWAGP